MGKIWKTYFIFFSVIALIRPPPLIILKIPYNEKSSHFLVVYTSIIIVSWVLRFLPYEINTPEKNKLHMTVIDTIMRFANCSAIYFFFWVPFLPVHLCRCFFFFSPLIIAMALRSIWIFVTFSCAFRTFLFRVNKLQNIYYSRVCSNFLPPPPHLLCTK